MSLPKPYYQNNLVTIYQNDCLEAMREMPENSIDSIVTDPPYGINFMGKKWDYDVPSVEIWKECLRVLKPGGYLLSFAGTRTQHRMAVNIEDAGFEIRDMIAWLYCSGFPKSLDVGKAVDRLQGNEREVTGTTTSGKILRANGQNERPYQDGKDRFVCDVSKGTSPWEGWGTALKPALESVSIFQKPLDMFGYCAIMYNNLLGGIKLCEQNAKSAEKNLEPTPVELKEGKTNSVQENAETNQGDDLGIKMGTGKEDDIDLKAGISESIQVMEHIGLNTFLLWKNILEGILSEEKTFIISMGLETITDWRTLSYCLSGAIHRCTTKEKSNQNGESADVLPVENYLIASFALLKNTLMLSALAPAMSSEVENSLDVGVSPNLSPIIMSRKPLSEKTVAENVLKYGTGGINIDGGRVGANDKLDGGATTGSVSASDGWDRPWRHNQEAVLAMSERVKKQVAKGEKMGRFPANLIHDGSEEVEAVFPDSDGQQGDLKGHNKDRQSPHGCYGKFSPAADHLKRNDSGSASRFFYCAKASKADRNEGLDGFEEKTWKEQGFRDNDSTHLSPRAGAGRTSLLKNNHPTVKPTSLMQYLVRLVTQPGGTVLDPFMGSGSTGKACVIEGFKFIGMDDDEKIDCCGIAVARCEYAEKIRKEKETGLTITEQKMYGKTLFDK